MAQSGGVEICASRNAPARSRKSTYRRDLECGRSTASTQEADSLSACGKIGGSGSDRWVLGHEHPGIWGIRPRPLACVKHSRWERDCSANRQAPAYRQDPHRNETAYDVVIVDPDCRPSVAWPLTRLDPAGSDQH